MRLSRAGAPARRRSGGRPSWSADPLVALDAELTAKQRELLDALVAAPSVSAAAADLGMSRSNVYASLRRVGRKVGVTDVSELLRLLRAGRLDAAARTPDVAPDATCCARCRFPPRRHGGHLRRVRRRRLARAARAGRRGGCAT